MKAKHVLGQNLFSEKICVTAGTAVHTTDASLPLIPNQSNQCCSKILFLLFTKGHIFKWDFQL